MQLLQTVLTVLAIYTRLLSFVKSGILTEQQCNVNMNGKEAVQSHCDDPCQWAEAHRSITKNHDRVKMCEPNQVSRLQSSLQTCINSLQKAKTERQSSKQERPTQQ